MRRAMFAATAFVLTGAMVATAQDPPPAVQPPAAQPKVVPVQPGGFQPRPATVTAAKMAQLEEEFETLEAHRDVKKGHVKLAELGVRVAQLEAERLKVAVTKGIVSKEEFDRAALELESAKVRVDICMAELKEVEVKVKFAKKRLDDAKAIGVRPAPVPAPRGGDEKPFAADEKTTNEKVTAELKAKLAEVEAKLETNAAEAKKADAAVKDAETALAKIQEVAKLGRIRAGTIETAEAKVKDAKDVVDKLEAAKRKLKDQQATIQEALKKPGN